MKNWIYMAIIILAACSPKAISLTKSAAEFKSVINNRGTQLIDVRTPAEFKDGHIEGAVNFDIYSADFEKNLKGLNKSKPVAVYCKSGGRSSNAINTLQKMGFKKLYELDGGIDAWKSSGMKVVKSARSSSDHPEDKLSFEEIIASERLTMVDFYADWCGPCKMMAPHIKKLKDEMHEDIYVRKVNTDHRRDLAKKYNISGLPTLVFFKNSKEIYRIMGYQSEEALIEIIRRLR